MPLAKLSEVIDSRQQMKYSFCRVEQEGVLFISIEQARHFSSETPCAIR